MYPSTDFMCLFFYIQSCYKAFAITKQYLQAFAIHWMKAIAAVLLINLYMCTLYFSNNLIACIKALVHALLLDCRVWKRWPAPDGCSGDSIRMQGSLSPLSPSPCIEQLWWFHLHTNNQPGLRQPPSVWLLLSLVSPAV